MSVPWKVETLTNSHRKVLEPLIRENWGGPTIATRGKLLDVRELPGLFVEKDGQPCRIPVLTIPRERIGKWWCWRP